MAGPEYERGWRAGYIDAQRWHLVLDRVQRDNLLFVLNLLGEPYSSGAVPPFDILNSGSWVNEIATMLAADGTEAQFQMNAAKTGAPIQTREDVFALLGKFLGQ